MRYLMADRLDAILLHERGAPTFLALAFFWRYGAGILTERGANCVRIVISPDVLSLSNQSIDLAIFLQVYRFSRRLSEDRKEICL
jgi:hypothetical protein